MICSACGSQTHEAGAFCSVCGAEIIDVPKVRTESLSRRQFIKKHISKSYKANFVIVAVFLYASAALNIVASYYSGNVYYLLDTVLGVGLGLLLQFLPNLITSITTGVYITLSLILNVLVSDRVNIRGTFLLIVSVLAIVSAVKIRKEWKKYNANPYSYIPETKLTNNFENINKRNRASKSVGITFAIIGSVFIVFVIVISILFL